MKKIKKAKVIKLKTGTKQTTHTKLVVGKIKPKKEHKSEYDQQLEDYGPREESEAWLAFVTLKKLYERTVKRAETKQAKEYCAAIYYGMGAVQEMTGGGVPIHIISSDLMPNWEKKLDDALRPSS